MGDWELLQSYVSTGSEEAFAELVRRHVNWVYSVALRRVEDAQPAQDIVQSVFTLLARKARCLKADTVLNGWLFRSTLFVAKCALRTERRRKSREVMASTMMTPEQNDETNLHWEEIAPQLDQAVASLSASDRRTVLLRFYQKASHAELGQSIGVSEEAAKKRVCRAVEKLRNILARRGVTLGTGLLAMVLTEKTVAAAPASLVVAVVKGSITNTSASTAALPVLARDALNACRWAKVYLLGIPGLVALVCLWLSQTLGTHNSDSESRLDGAATVTSIQLQGTTSRAAAPANSTSQTAGQKLLFRVVAADTGKGIAAARILVNYVSGDEWLQPDELATDSEGLCPIPLPAKDFGRLDIGALKDGFVQKFYTWRADYGVPSPSVYILKLEHAVRIGGQVRDAAGKPVSDAQIGLSFHGAGDASFREPAWERLGFVMGAVPAARTDAQGNWRLALTPPGNADFNVEVQHSNYVQRSFALETGPVGPPNSHSRTSLRLEELLGGTAVMILEQGYGLRGFVVDDVGNPLEGARVSPMGSLNYRQDGVRTGTDGSFVIPGLAQGTQSISAWAKGFAPALAYVQVPANNSNLVFHLTRGATLGLQIIDESGSGIAGAFATIELPLPHNAEYRATTDINGRARIQGIPTNALNSLLFHAGSKGYFYARNIGTPRDGSEPIIRLAKALHVSGSVFDAESGKPIRDFKAMPCAGENSAGWDRSETKHGEGGAYTLDFCEPGAPYRVRIEADGYEAAMSPPMIEHPSEQIQDFKLTKAGLIRGNVLKPNGEPAVGVGVCLLTFEQGATLYRGTFKPGDGAILAVSGPQGEFTFPSGQQAHTLVAANPAFGFGLLRMHHSFPPFTLRLEPWGRIEGQVLLSGGVAVGQQVCLARGMPSYRSLQDGLYVGFDFLNTDEAGRFMCEWVPPGDVTLYLSHGTGRPNSHQTIVEVRAGETTQVQVGGGGRQVIGKLEFSNEHKVDWTSEIITASLVSNLPRPTTQPPPDSPDFAQRLRVLDFFDQSQEWHAFERASGSYPLQVTADGTFSAENVPAGPYRLMVTLSDSPYTGTDPLTRFRCNITASTRQELVVPETNGLSAAVNIGTFKLQPGSSRTGRP